MMATVVKISCSLGVLKIRTLFVSVSPFFFVNSSSQTFYEAFTCLIRNYVTNISKPRAMLNETKKTSCPWGRPCVWTLTDHGQPPITTRIAFKSLYRDLISLFRSMNQCIHHSTLLYIAWSVALETSSTPFILPFCLCLNLFSNTIPSLYQGAFECSVTVHVLTGATSSNLIIFPKLN